MTEHQTDTARAADDLSEGDAPALALSVLVVDDDPGIGRTLRLNLQARGYDVHLAADGRTALSSISERPPDLVILDLGLPDVDGLHLLTRIRQTSQTPVLVLSARHGSTTKVAALDLGADDYLTKPFDIQELLARLRVALRHRKPEVTPAPRLIVTDHLEIDLGKRSARRDGQPVHLTPTEWRLLEELAGHPGELIDHQELLRRVWGPAYGTETNYLRVYLGQLRRKLEADPRQPRHLITEPGAGYRFLS